MIIGQEIFALNPLLMTALLVAHGTVLRNFGLLTFQEE